MHVTSLLNVSENLRFALSNARISYLFQVSPEGLLEHVYFGQRIADEGALPAVPRRAYRCTTLEFQGVENYNLSDTPQEFPLFGTSDARQPMFHAINSAGNSTNVFVYHSHEVLADKPPLDGLPSARGGDSETLIVTLKDAVSQLRVKLFYTVYRDHDVIARSVQIFNDGEQAVELSHALSSSLDLPADDYELLHLRGTWSREMNEQRMDLPAGRFTLESASGTSSNHHNPFIALMQKGANEQHGQVIATALVYSGNFAISVEQGEFDSVRVSAGINPFNFRWLLSAGESFTCPEVLHCFSAQGLGGMSQTWHRFIQQQISPPQFNGVARPTYLNSWEAAYFDVSEDVVLSLADKAKSLGLDMLVVDDGWFKGRNDDTSSLGDWYSDTAKFPNGIEATAEKVKHKGLKFGLWFEPEMVNPESDLYRAHPDWVIHVPDRKLTTGRNQLILDLSRSEVVDYLFERIDSTLSCGNIDYVKWDMNRLMSEIGSAGLAKQQQLETAHRYMLGVYGLLGRITAKYPQVLFENCASGGNRFDLGMLRFMAQTWTSDMSEPIGRLAIVNGASYLFPPSVLASYIGPVPSHQNDRLSSIKLRGEVGFFCAARGLSLNVEDIDNDEQALKEFIELYKATATDLASARFYRLKYTNNEVCWQLTSADHKTIYLGYFHILSAPNLPYRRAHLRGLDAGANYQLKSNGEKYNGAALMRMGIDLPYVHAMQFSNDTDYMDRGDFSSRLMVFDKC